MSTPMIPPAVIVADPAFEALRKEILGATGLNYYEKQPEELARRIAQRLWALNVHNVDAYVKRLSDLATKGAEWDSLIAELTVGETFFFRHREQFDALREHVFPALIERNRPIARLRIWSAGCACGAEPYSIAILLAQEFNAQLAGWDVSILGTDINRQYLLRALRAAFSDWELRSIPAEIRESCFCQEGGKWVLRPNFKRGVSFEFHNLIQPAPFMCPGGSSTFDLILCRNVMIYFEPAAAYQLIGRLHECLNEGGWLLVGHGESNVESFRSFRTVNVPGAVIYNKVEPVAIPESPRQPNPVFEPGHGDFQTMPEVPVTHRGQPAKVPARTSGATARQRHDAPRAAIDQQLASVRMQLDRAQWNEAAMGCDDVISAVPLNPFAHFYRAVALEQLGRAVETERSLRRAIYLDRGFVLAHYYLGLLLQKKCDAPGAKRAFGNASLLLERLDASHVFADADGLTAGVLKQWTQTQTEVLREQDR